MDNRRVNRTSDAPSCPRQEVESPEPWKRAGGVVKSVSCPVRLFGTTCVLFYEKIILWRFLLIIHHRTIQQCHPQDFCFNTSDITIGRNYNYRLQRSCGKVMFSQASVILAGRHPPGRQLPNRADTPLGRHPPQQTATAADGTQPTAMHSCC